MQKIKLAREAYLNKVYSTTVDDRKEVSMKKRIRHLPDGQEDFGQ